MKDNKHELLADNVRLLFGIFWLIAIVGGSVMISFKFLSMLYDVLF